MSSTFRNKLQTGQTEGSLPVRSNQQGFTLIELIIAMALTLISMGLIYSGYKTQQEAYANERLTVDMQQNARSALAFMRREIRMAGYAPRALNGVDDDMDGSIDEADESVVRGFQTVRANHLNFTLDLNGNGTDLDDNENITYGFDNADDGNGDGIADAGAAALGREHRSGTGLQPLAFDVHAVAFAYAFDVDGDGALDTYPGVPNGVVVWAYDSDGDGRLDRHLDTNMDGLIDENDTAGGASLASVGSPIPASVNRDQVRSVQVWILTRSQAPMRGRSAQAQTFVVGPHRIAANDGFKRSLFNSMITVRNPT
jgi:prepilin-type N-terminal cleavage/methylation domain-containing protein